MQRRRVGRGNRRVEEVREREAADTDEGEVAAWRSQAGGGAVNVSTSPGFESLGLRVNNDWKRKRGEEWIACACN